MAWKQYPKKRVHRYEQQPQPQPPTYSAPAPVSQPAQDLTDANGNHYPDVFEAEEAQVLEQIRLRRKQYGYNKQVEAYSGIGNSSADAYGDPMEEKKSAFRDILGM